MCHASAKPPLLGLVVKTVIQSFNLFTKIHASIQKAPVPGAKSVLIPAFIPSLVPSNAKL
jgi:hypothetical protein